MTCSPTIPRQTGASDALRAHNAVRAIGRGVLAGLVVVLLVLLSALPDEVPSWPARSGGAAVAMKAAPATSQDQSPLLVSVASSDADLPPGDGRELGPALPFVARLPLAAGFTIASGEPPPPVASALIERPPKAA